jgi:hypothetical protein
LDGSDSGAFPVFDSLDEAGNAIRFNARSTWRAITASRSQAAFHPTKLSPSRLRQSPDPAA